jgi:flavodoxin I
MEKVGIIYGFNATKSSKIAERIKEAFGEDPVEMVNAEELTPEKFMEFSNMILGVPTWFDGELPNYWDEFIPALEELDLSNKKIALYGLGDQVKYSENFVDAIGIMAEIVRDLGASLVGFTSTEGYKFEASRGVEEDKFLGLAIDYENQGSKNKERVSAWVQQLKNEFN